MNQLPDPRLVTLKNVLCPLMRQLGTPSQKKWYSALMMSQPFDDVEKSVQTVFLSRLQDCIEFRHEKAPQSVVTREALYKAASRLDFILFHKNFDPLTFEDKNDIAVGKEDRAYYCAKTLYFAIIHNRSK